MRVAKELKSSRLRAKLRNDSILKQGTDRGHLHRKPNLHRETLLEWAFLYYRHMDDYGQFNLMRPSLSWSFIIRVV